MSATIDAMPEPNKLFVGKGVTIRGVVMATDTVVVDGLLEGDIAAENLLVNETGTIRGRIVVARDAEIFGKVFEKLDVKGLLVLRATSRVDGSVSFGTVTIEQGACISGEVSSADHQPTQAVSRPERAAEITPAVAAAKVQPIELSALDLIPSPVARTA
jgi:cytoskeletal protein CcmA (bactofilin family)